MSSSSRRAPGVARAQQARAASTGFTLLEVLAAVALLAILYTVLARVAIEGLRAEGESDRRLEASLLADTWLEGALFGPDGALTLPPLGHSETAEGDFTVVLDVTPFVPPPEWKIDDPEGPKPVLFAEATGSSGPMLRTIQLLVSWLEGAEERHVSRTMFAVDFAQVAALAEAAGPGGTGPTGIEELDEFERQIQGEAPSEVEPP